jgi:hypothetical protein
MWIKFEDKIYSYVGEDTCFPCELPEKIAAGCRALIIVKQISNIFY